MAGWSPSNPKACALALRVPRVIPHEPRSCVGPSSILQGSGQAECLVSVLDLSFHPSLLEEAQQSPHFRAGRNPQGIHEVLACDEALSTNRCGISSEVEFEKGIQQPEEGSMRGKSK